MYAHLAILPGAQTAMNTLSVCWVLLGVLGAAWITEGLPKQFAVLDSSKRWLLCHLQTPIGSFCTACRVAYRARWEVLAQDSRVRKP